MNPYDFHLPTCSAQHHSLSACVHTCLSHVVCMK
jgi:hypothetical protein